AAALAKGQAWLQRVSHIAKPASGVAASCIHHLYMSQAVPHMLYRAELFLPPPDLRNPTKVPVTFLPLRSIQWKAALLITGGLHSSPYDALDLLADLLSFHLLVSRMQWQALLRYCTLPVSHPLASFVQKAVSYQCLHVHNSPLHLLFEAFPLHPKHIEMITVARYTPSWSPPFTVQIAKDTCSAIIQDANDASDIVIYTDGSGFKNKIGASVVLYHRGRRVDSLCYQLGRDSAYAVYNAESLGLVLGARLL
ncbi:hypothetical protein BDQ17DRAFT_1172146, partial [Cyathus striatus]